MVLTSAPTFKRTLHTSTWDARDIPTIPFQLEVTVCRQATTQKYQIDVGMLTTTAIAGAELTGIEFYSSDTGRASGEMCVFAQQLDGQGRASSHPFALVAQSAGNTLAPRAIKVPIQSGQTVRLLLFAREGSVPAVVRLGGHFVPAHGGSGAGHPKIAAKIQKFVQGPWEFVPELGRNAQKATERKRSLSVEISLDSDGSSEDVDSDSAEEQSDDSSIPPNLIYAQVAGDDDES